MLWRQQLIGYQRLDHRTEPVLDIQLSAISTSGIDNVRTQESEERFNSLMASMATSGLINPITVAPNRNRVGRYFLVCGFRRYRAACELGWPTIRASVRELSSVAEAHLLNLAENIERSSITSYELAARCEFMVRKFGMRVSELAKHLGYSTSHIHNLVRLLTELPPSILEDWKSAHPLLSCSRLERLSRDFDGETKWQVMRRQHALEEGKRPPSLEEQFGAIEDNNDPTNDVTGWQPYKRPTKAAILRLRDILGRQHLPDEPEKVREMLVGICDYMRGATGSIPHVLTPHAKKRARPTSKNLMSP